MKNVSCKNYGDFVDFEKSFDDAIEDGIQRASKTLDNITGAWINEMKVDVKDGKISSYRVNMKLTFVLRD